MAFRLRLDDAIEKEFRRIGAEQIERALRQLAAGADLSIAVHETRKCMKRARALLRLAREGLGESVFGAENARLREIAAQLATSRDDQVMIETATLLASEADGGRQDVLKRIKAALVASQSREAPAADPEVVAAARADLERALRRFRRLRLGSDDVSVLVRGHVRSYRKGRKLSQSIALSDSAETFHDWRKSVQTHWRHMQLFSKAWPDMAEARVALARDLSQILGEDHDLAVLDARLAELESDSLTADDINEVRDIIGQRQRALRTSALPRGRALFAAGSEAHGRWLTGVWEAAIARNVLETATSADTEASPRAKHKPRATAKA